MLQVRLLYRSSDYLGFDDFIKATPEYYQVTEYPVAEMTGSDPLDWANDFIEVSNSEQWSSQNRRRVQPGDLMISGDRIFLFVRADEPNISLTRLPNWPSLGLKELAQPLAHVLHAYFSYLDGTTT